MRAYAHHQADTAIVAVVDRFYERLLSKGSPVEKFFAGHDHTKLRNHQIAFITFAFGGPSRYAGRSMNASHARRAPRTRASSPASAGGGAAIRSIKGRAASCGLGPPRRASAEVRICAPLRRSTRSVAG